MGWERKQGGSGTYVRVVLVSVFPVARMTGVRDLAFLVIQNRKSRSEKLPLKLDLDNTSERTCLLYPSSLPCGVWFVIIANQTLLTTSFGGVDAVCYWQVSEDPRIIPGMNP